MLCLSHVNKTRTSLKTRLYTLSQREKPTSLRYHTYTWYASRLPHGSKGMAYTHRKHQRSSIARVHDKPLASHTVYLLATLDLPARSTCPNHTIFYTTIIFTRLIEVMVWLPFRRPRVMGLCSDGPNSLNAHFQCVVSHDVLVWETSFWPWTHTVYASQLLSGQALSKSPSDASDQALPA